MSNNKVDDSIDAVRVNRVGRKLSKSVQSSQSNNNIMYVPEIVK